MLSSKNKSFPWGSFWLAFLFFFYFSGFYQLFLFLSAQSGFNGFRQNIYMNFLWLIPLIVFPRQTKLISITIGTILWATSLVFLAYYAVYGQNFSQSVLFIIFESNFRESNEYLESYFSWWIIFGLLTYTIVAILLWRQIRPIVLPIKTRFISVSILVFIVSWPLINYLFVHNSSLDKAVHAQMDRMEPVAPWHLIVGYTKYKEQLHEIEKNLLENRNLAPLENLSLKNINIPNTLVLVIGESTTKQKMSLYGYVRKTTPKLDKIRDDLLIFNHVYAPRPYTIETLEQVLTFADEQHPKLYLTKPTLINMMKQAAYKTFWITNQQTQTKRNTLLTTFSKQADEQIYLNNNRTQNAAQYDGAVIKPFKKVLSDQAKKKFIVVHLLGTHRKYEYRYPDDFALFDDAKNAPEYLKGKQLKEYNQYDNAVLYNDYVVSELIALFKKSQSNGFMVYFSDHGEEVYDDPKHLFAGRTESAPTEAMYSIPFIIWQSDSWKKDNKMRVINKSATLNRFYSTSDFIYTWADLVGIHFTGFDASRSIINPLFSKHPIWIGNPDKPETLRDLRHSPLSL